MNDIYTTTINDVPHLESLIHRCFPKPYGLLLSKSLFHVGNNGIDSFVVLYRNDIEKQYPNGIPNTDKFLLHEDFRSYMIYLYKSDNAEDGVLENLFSEVCKSLSTTDVLWGRPKLYEEKNAFKELNFCRITQFTYAFQIDTPTNMGILKKINTP